MSFSMPMVGLGTWLISNDEVSRVVTDALNLGYKHIDTAQIYQNESGIGEAISKVSIDRDKFFITTKIYTLVIKNDEIDSSFNKSLQKLKTDYVDLLLIHFPAFTTNLDDMLAILYKIKESSRVKNIGISNFNHNLVKDCIRLGYNDIFCNQVEYHPYLNQKKLISIIKKSGILPVAYSPLAKGELLQEKLIIDISKKYSKTPAQIILRWLNQQNWVAIPKSSNKKRLIENINIFDFTIDENDMNSLHKLNKNYRVVPSALGTFHQIDLPSKHTNKGLELI